MPLVAVRGAQDLQGGEVAAAGDRLRWEPQDLEGVAEEDPVHLPALVVAAHRAAVVLRPLQDAPRLKDVADCK